MNDQHDHADYEKNVNESAGDVERDPGDQPNAEEEESQYQEQETH
jgi:hypothetical protein